MKLIITALSVMLISGCSGMGMHSGMGMSSGMGGMSSYGSSGNSAPMQDQTTPLMYSGGGN